MNSAEGTSRQAGSTPAPRAIAPVWHTVVILLFFVAISFAGARGIQSGIQARGRAVLYVVMIAQQWLTVAFIWYGVSRRGVRMADLVGGRWARPADLLRDIGIGIAFLIICGFGAMGVIEHLLRVVPNPAVRQILPQTPAEDVLWVVVALGAGFNEELVYRGYLQRQFTVLTRTVAGGIALQAIVFGFSHGYQGWRSMLGIVVLGGMLGLLAHWRRSLRPGMIAHAMQDGLVGLFARYLMR